MRFLSTFSALVALAVVNAHVLEARDDLKGVRRALPVLEKRNRSVYSTTSDATSRNTPSRYSASTRGSKTSTSSYSQTDSRDSRSQYSSTSTVKPDKQSDTQSTYSRSSRVAKKNDGPPIFQTPNFAGGGKLGPVSEYSSSVAPSRSVASSRASAASKNSQSQYSSSVTSSSYAPSVASTSIDSRVRVSTKPTDIRVDAIHSNGERSRTFYKLKSRRSLPSELVKRSGRPAFRTPDYSGRGVRGPVPQYSPSQAGSSRQSTRSSQAESMYSTSTDPDIGRPYAPQKFNMDTTTNEMARAVVTGQKKDAFFRKEAQDKYFKGLDHKSSPRKAETYKSSSRESNPHRSSSSHSTTSTIRPPRSSGSSTVKAPSRGESSRSSRSSSQASSRADDRQGARLSRPQDRSSRYAPPRGPAPSGNSRRPSGSLSRPFATLSLAPGSSATIESKSRGTSYTIKKLYRRCSLPSRLIKRANGADSAASDPVEKLTADLSKLSITPTLKPVSGTALMKARKNRDPVEKLAVDLNKLTITPKPNIEKLTADMSKLTITPNKVRPPKHKPENLSIPDAKKRNKLGPGSQGVRLHRRTMWARVEELD
ncbi:hypothetical protein C8J56DRAFT_1110561 [Mycena floridula]|nr:hypothetical protein C8J56DRAFT_1110561 [Mycena floridula]